MADTYTVTGQTPVTDLSPTGTFVPAMEITFTTKPSGVMGRVRVPLAQYTPDVVDHAISVQAELIEQVQAL